MLLVATLMLGMVSKGLAQEGSQGNTTIFANGQMTFFGNHNFVTGGSGSQPGVILTERAAGNIGYLNFSGDGITTTGANDANYVDGYVRKYGSGSFIFPVGDNGSYGPFAANADGTSGAYYFTDPNTAETTNLFTGGNYGPLPSGTTFSTTNKTTNVGTVSTREYWDIDGAIATQITLTWSENSDVSTLTGDQLSRLIIVGWNATQSRWEKLASTIDPTSILGGASSLTSGSITTNANIIPNNYTVYTLATQVPDLTPTNDIDVLSLTLAIDNRDFIVNLYEINNTDATGLISFRITKLSSFTITYSSTSGTSAVLGGIANENSNWVFSENSNFIIVTAKPGVTIPQGGHAKIGFNIKRNSGIASGNAQNITTSIVGGSGGEIYLANHQVVITITAN